jgi:hypothetical protein
MIDTLLLSTDVAFDGAIARLLCDLGFTLSRVLLQQNKLQNSPRDQARRNNTKIEPAINAAFFSRGTSSSSVVVVCADLTGMTCSMPLLDECNN